MKKDFTKKDFYDKLTLNGECLEWSGGTFNHGYGCTSAYGKNWYTHRLALHLEGTDVSGYYVLHSCDNPICCNPAHLRIGTQKENMDDMMSRGRCNIVLGEDRTQSKLTEKQVLQIRAITGMTQKAIADQFGVDISTISLIRNRVTWKHI